MALRGLFDGSVVPGIELSYKITFGMSEGPYQD